MLTSAVSCFILMHASYFRPIYAGNALCTVRYTGEDPCMMSIRSTSFSPTTEAMSETKVAPITQVDLSFLSEGLFCFSTIIFY
jgi:electron transfer flavoprotein alpha subunit